MRPQHILAALLLAVGGAGLVSAWSARTFVSHYNFVLGTSLDISIAASSPHAARRAEAGALAEIDRLASILSAYDPSSEFSRWVRTRDTAEPVSVELFDILQRFDHWRAETGGALDASAETVSRVWKAAASAGRVPTDREVSAAVDHVRRVHWRLDPVLRTATHTDDAPLVLNSFTKSYIVDRAAAIGMREPGVSGIVVNIGGDVVVRGSWTETVSVADPLADAENGAPLTRLAVRDRAVATSGGYRRGFDIAGTHYSHIVDPRTGRPTGHVLSATVIAPAGVDAGALATAMCVLSPDESVRLASVVPGAEFLLVQADGRRVQSAGWQRLTVPSPRPVMAFGPTLHAAGQAMWKAGLELTVTLEIVQQPTRAERPYVAVWIEDANRAPVRTLALWYAPDESRFMQDLRVWHRADRARVQAGGRELMGSVSSATRAPGKYTLTWDGKDDAGRVVKAGTYTVFIEAAREHGTYQILRKEMDFSGTPARVDLPGGLEITSASLDYHRVVAR